MKTKTTLLTALVAFAGGASLMAQVYSVNMVGYINQTVPAGFSIVANQLNNSPDNKVTTIFTNAPDQTTVYKFNPSNGGYIVLQHFAGSGWFGDDENMSLSPGEAAFIYAPVQFTNTFVGEVQLNSTNNIPSGFSLISSVIPQAGPVSPNLGFPTPDGITVFQYNPANGGYLVDQYFGTPTAGDWFGDTTSGGMTGPSVTVGQGFFVQTTTGTNWVRNFSVGN